MITIHDWQLNKDKWLDTDLALMTSDAGWKKRTKKKGISIWQQPFDDDKKDLFRWRIPVLSSLPPLSQVLNFPNRTEAIVSGLCLNTYPEAVNRPPTSY